MGSEPGGIAASDHDVALVSSLRTRGARRKRKNGEGRTHSHPHQTHSDDQPFLPNSLWDKTSSSASSNHRFLLDIELVLR